MLTWPTNSRPQTTNTSRNLKRERDYMTTEIDIVFDGPPSHESGRFVEVESPVGRSIRFGIWVHRPDGFWALRFYTFTVSDILDALEMLSWEDREHVLDRLGVMPHQRG